MITLPAISGAELSLALPLRAREANGVQAGADAEPVEQSDESGQAAAPPAAAVAQAEGPDGLSAEERRIVAELARTDQEVRAHEQAHLAAAGGLARGVSFSFVTGPDGRQYATGGEVSIDTSPVQGDPERTIQKAQQIRAAANAPARPSGQDLQVAAQASAMEQAARAELAVSQGQERETEQQGAVASAYRAGDAPESNDFELSVVA